MEDQNDNVVDGGEINCRPPKAKTGPKPKDLVTVEVTGYEVGRGMTKKVVFDEDVFKLAAMGCSNAEIARWFDIDESTLAYNFNTILAKGREQLKQSLRRAQIKLALSGNAVMLIWLGKNLLGQSDTPTNADDRQPLPWTDEE
jgi:hypothetical protein